MNNINNTKKTTFQAILEIIRCFSENEDSQSSRCGTVSQPITEYQNCGCGTVNQPVTEYQNCGCGTVSQPVTDYQISGCCSSGQPAAAYQGCGCGSVDKVDNSNPGGISGYIAGYLFESGYSARLAGIKTGEVVLDIGSGGGTDCFEAARLTGPEGKVIGLDPAPEMIELARNNTKKTGFTNVEFKQGEIKNIPLPNESVDVILSNFTLNPAPDKDAVFAEAYRVLRPGGRLNVSDTVISGNSSEKMMADRITSALTEHEYLEKIRATGFFRVETVSKIDIQVQMSGYKLAEIKVLAYKP